VSLFDNAPPWFQWALHEVGIRETPGRASTPRVMAYRKLARIEIDGDDSDVPWCAIFANAALEQSGIPGTRSAASQSFRHSERFVPLAGPALGAIAVFWRGRRDSGLGHVGFYRGEAGDRIYVLGGNEGDAVAIEPFRRSAPRFGLIGYWWPASVTRPTVSPIQVQAGAAAREVGVT